MPLKYVLRTLYYIGRHEQMSLNAKGNETTKRETSPLSLLVYIF